VEESIMPGGADKTIKEGNQKEAKNMTHALWFILISHRAKMTLIKCELGPFVNTKNKLFLSVYS
jgi:hypothetical protein